MALYLFGLGVEPDKKALMAACFFGHSEMVNLLLKLGMDFNDIGVSLFLMVLDGYDTKNKTSFSYDNLINNDNIFRNDVYNYGVNHIEIFKLLLHNISMNDWKFIRYLPVDFYDLDIFTYLLSESFDINQKLCFDHMGNPCDATVLEMSIIHNKINITELLLQHGTNISITFVNAIKLINDNEEFKTLLEKYGVNI